MAPEIVVNIWPELDIGEKKVEAGRLHCACYEGYFCNNYSHSFKFWTECLLGTVLILSQGRILDLPINAPKY